MTRCLAFAVVFPAGIAATFFKGNSFDDCRTKCLAEDDDCDGFDSCETAQVCDFQCSCVQHCDESNESWSFSLCNDYLKTCFQQAPVEGYAHLDCWNHTCPAYYNQVAREREAGQWQGLGGWQVFGAPLPEASQLLHSATAPYGAVSSVLLLAVMVLVARLAMRRRTRQSDGELLGSEDEEAAIVE